MYVDVCMCVSMYVCMDVDMYNVYLSVCINIKNV